MPIEGFPDADEHEICIRCRVWHYPEEGTKVFIEPFNPLRSIRASIVGDGSLNRFMSDYSKMAKENTLGHFLGLVLNNFSP